MAFVAGEFNLSLLTSITDAVDHHLPANLGPGEERFVGTEGMVSWNGDVLACERERGEKKPDSIMLECV